MLNKLTISKNKPRKAELDYRQLYAAGLKCIRTVAGKVWTDFNTHDPGVTTLELLCYALTDLSYRCDMPIEDLLAGDNDDAPEMTSPFFTAARILPSRPLTLLDYRKILIDLPGVKNAWINPGKQTVYADTANSRLLHENTGEPQIEAVHIRGLYRVLIDYMEGLTAAAKADVLEAVRSTLHANRNLCEDFVGFSEVEGQHFLLCGEFELTPEADQADIKAQILWRVQNYLAPAVNNYSLDQMLAKTKDDGSRYSAREIFEGPYLMCGFIPDNELENADLRSQIRLSDVIGTIMDIPGVVAVKQIVINPKRLSAPLENKWVVSVDSGKKALLDQEGSPLLFYKNGLRINPDDVKVQSAYNELTRASVQKQETRAQDDFDVRMGKFRDLSDYYSLQNHFPAVYGIGENGLKANADESRKSQALQLKAYLLFFEQVMANYFKQLSEVKKLFSTDPGLSRTYFYQAVDTFKDWEKIYDTADPVTTIEDEIEDKRDLIDRRNRFLDHLIARFAEQFTDFANIMYSAFAVGPQALVHYKCDFLNAYPTISADRGLAYNYKLKGKGVWNSPNVSGLEKRLCKLLGIANSDRRNLSDVAYDIYDEIDITPDDEFRFRIRNRDNGQILLSSSTNYKTREICRRAMRRAVLYGGFGSNYEKKIAVDGKHYFNVVDDTGEVVARRIQYFTTQTAMETAIDEVIVYLRANYSDEGMYLIENILLRPENPADPFLPICIDTDCQSCPDRDPYSYRLHIILPAYGARFANMDFRQYAEMLIRAEVPAHILPKICWVDKDDMAALEGAYQRWLKIRHSVTTVNRQQIMNNFIEILYAVKNVYPREQLTECKKAGAPKFVLSRSRIGSFNDVISSGDSDGPG